MGQSRFGTGLVAGVLGGLLVGWMLAKLRQSGARIAPEPPLATTAERVQSQAPGAAHALPPSQRVTASEEAREAPPEASPESDGGLISDALRDYALDGVRRSWSGTRAVPMSDAELAEQMKRFERSVLLYPEILGRGAAEDANEVEESEEPEPKPDPLEAFLAHDPIGLLARIGESGSREPRLELVNDAAGFGQLFPSSLGKALDGASHLMDPDKAVEDGTVLDFPAGVFRLRHLMLEKDPFPRDVTLRGAGMDATLLLIGSLYTHGELRNFTLRNCTVFTDGVLFDLREQPASVRFEGVRAVGFDAGAGSSCLIAANRGLALLARASRFEGGYGRLPWAGRLFDVRTDAFLARFEGCWIDEVSVFEFLHRGASLAFVGCSLTNLLDMAGARDPPGVSSAGSTVAYFPGERTQAPRKDLNDLFPDWEKRIQQ